MEPEANDNDNDINNDDPTVRDRNDVNNPVGVGNGGDDEAPEAGQQVPPAILDGTTIGRFIHDIVVAANRANIPIPPVQPQVGPDAAQPPRLLLLQPLKSHQRG